MFKLSCNKISEYENYILFNLICKSTFYIFELANHRSLTVVKINNIKLYKLMKNLALNHIYLKNYYIKLEYN